MQVRIRVTVTAAPSQQGLKLFDRQAGDANDFVQPAAFYVLSRVDKHKGAAARVVAAAHQMMASFDPGDLNARAPQCADRLFRAGAKAADRSRRNRDQFKLRLDIGRYWLASRQAILDN